jgi:hypothetical protein
VRPGDAAGAERALTAALAAPRAERDLEEFTRRSLAARLANILEDARR